MSISPNPFSYGTYISYELKEKGRVNISGYSISGKKVKTLINSSGMPSDSGKIYWDGRNHDGNALPAGTYIFRMTLEDKLVEAEKVVKK
jgi:flagellar hook assembly protein FlgD